MYMIESRTDWKDNTRKVRIESWRQVYLPLTRYVLQPKRHELKFQAVSRMNSQKLMTCPT